MYKFVLALGILAHAVAGDYVATLLILGAGDQSIVGKVIASDSTATTYSLDCPASEGQESCGVPTSFSFTQGPSTVHYVIPQYKADHNPESIDIQCSLTSLGGSCTEAIIMAGSTVSKEATTYTNFASQIGFQKVLITAGPTPGATGGSSSVPSTSTLPSAATKTGDVSTASSPTSSGSVATGISASSTKVSTGGVQMITGRPQWLVGGAAAAVAIAAL